MSGVRPNTARTRQIVNTVRQLELYGPTLTLSGKPDAADIRRFLERVLVDPPGFQELIQISDLKALNRVFVRDDDPGHFEFSYPEGA